MECTRLAVVVVFAIGLAEDLIRAVSCADPIRANIPVDVSIIII